MMRGRVGLECSECGQRNYTLKKSAEAVSSLVTLKKYCPEL